MVCLFRREDGNDEKQGDGWFVVGSDSKGVLFFRNNFKR